MEYLRNLYKQRDFNNEELSNEIHSLQTEMTRDSNSNLHHEKKNKILSELYQITSIPASQTKMNSSRWDELRFNIYLFIASMIPNCKQIPNLNLATNSGPLFYIMCFLNPYHMSFIYNQIGIKSDESSQTPVPLIMPQNFYTKEKSISVLMEIFDNFTQIIIEAQTSSFQFYTRSQLSYGHLIPLILLQEKTDFIKDPRFLKLFQFIKNTLYPRNAKVSNVNDKIILTYDMHYFLINLIRLIGNKGTKNLFDEVLQLMSCCFKDIPISSTIIAHYYQIPFQMKLNGDEISPSIEAFYQNSLLRVNDIFKTFKFYNIFEYFNLLYTFFLEHRQQPQRKLFIKRILYDVLLFIKQIINIPNPQDVINSRRKGSNSKPEQEFLKNLFNFYAQCEFRWPYLYFIEKIISALTFFTKKMNIIKAIKIRDATNKNICIEETISFYDQLSENDTYLQSKEKQLTSANSHLQSNMNSYQKPNTRETDIKKDHSKYNRNSYMNKINCDIDQLLFSAFECRTYTSFEDAISAYEKLVKVYDVSKRIYIPLNQFGFPILQRLLANEPSINRSTLTFYLERLLRSLINFIIFSSYRLMLLNTFTKTQQLHKNRVKNQSLTKPPEYALNYAKTIGEIINRSNVKHQNVLLIATTLADCLFNATKKQIITNHCIRCVSNILRGQANPLGNLLVQKMIEILYSNCLLESSYDNSEVTLFQQWLFLIIKINGRKGSVYPPNTHFASILRSYQHTFISYFFIKPNLMNQPEIILTIKKYIDSMKFNASEIGLKQFENPESKTILKFQKYYTLNGFRQEYQPEASTLFLDRVIFDYPENLFPLQLIDYAFQAKNNSIMRNLINLVSKQLERTSHYVDYETESNQVLFNNFLRPIHDLPKDLAMEYIELIPKIPPLFSPYTPLINISKQGYFINIDPRIDNFYKPLNNEDTDLAESDSIACVEYMKIISSTNKNTSRTKNEAKHLLMLISILIESKQALRFSLTDLENTLDALFSIARFVDLRIHVESLIDKMNKLFAPLILDSRSFDYVYAFTFSFVINQTESSKYAINQFKSFLYGINMTNYNGIVIADQLFSILKFPYNIFNVLLLFTILATKRPGCIKFSHFSSLFSLIKDQIYFVQQLSREMNLFSKLFKRFLEKFILSLNNEQKEFFMSYCYAIVKNRNYNNPIIKAIIIKKMPLLNIPFDRYDPNFYKSVNDELFFYIMSIIVGCGSRIPITQEMVDHAIEKLINPDLKQLLNRLNFVLMLTKAKININLFLKDDGPKQTFSKIFAFLARYSTPQYSKKFDKCISWAYSINPDLMRNLLQKNTSNSLDQIGNLLKDEKRTKFLQHFLTISSKYIEANHVVIVLIAITELTKELKLNIINTIISFLKILSSFDYSRDDLRIVLLSPSKQNPQITFLGQFLNDIIKLLLFNGLPVEEFIKTKVINFLLNFKMETIQYIFMYTIDFDSKYYFDLLYEMIISDKSNEMFITFIQSINLSEQFYPKHSPYIYDIESKLSEEPIYATEQTFIDKIKLQFGIFFNEQPNRIVPDNDSILLNSTIKAFINIMKFLPDFTNLVKLSSFFALGNNVYTSLYLKFKDDIFNNPDKQFYKEMLRFILNECAPNYNAETNQIIDNNVNYLKIDLEENNNIHRFITNSTTTILLSNLIKGFIRFPIDDDDDDLILFNHLLAMLRCMSKNQLQCFCAIKCYYTLFKNNKKISLNLIPELKYIFLAFPTLLEQPEPYPIILTFKFALKLLNHDLLHEKILSNILQQIFTFQKFFDNPYISIVSMLLNKANLYYTNIKHNQIPEALANSFKVFLIEKIILIKEFDKLFVVLKCFPAIIKTVPFSILTSMIHNIDTREKTQVAVIFQNLDNILKLYTIVDEVPEPIQAIFSKISFNFLYKYFELLEKDANYQQQLEQQIQNFLNFISMMMKHAKMMPEELLVSASKKIRHKSQAISRFCQVFCILSTEFVDENIVNNQFKVITESFDFLLKDGVIKPNYQYIRIYVQSIFSRPKLSRSFAKHFLNIVDTFHLNESHVQLISKFETVHQLLFFYVTDTKDNERKDHLITFLNNVDESTIQIMRLWVYNYLDFICVLQYEHQIILFNFIIEKLQKNSMELPFNINLLKSKSVSNKLKQRYLYLLQDNLPKLAYDEIYGLSQLINEFPFDCFNYKILYHLYLVLKSNDEGRLIHLDELAKILGKTEEERFISLFTYLPTSMWDNSAFIHIIFICMKHTKIIKPLAMLADCFEKIASKFAIPLFLRIMNDKTVAIFHKLLISVLSMNNNDSFSELISSIMSAYSMKSNEFSYNPITFRNEIKYTKISPKLLYKTVKITDDTHLYYDNLSLKVANSIPDKLLLPNKMNDEIFSFLPPNSSIESLAASAQFFLSNYDESSKVFYDYYDNIFSPDSTAISSPQIYFDERCSYFNLSVSSLNKASLLLKRMMDISDDFVSKKGTFRIFERYHHDDPYLIPSLENALNSLNISAPDNAMNEISIATMCNINYCKHHKHPSIYEFQRIISVEMILSIMNQRMPKKLEVLTNAPKTPQIAVPNMNLPPNPNMMKKMPNQPQQNISIPPSLYKIPSIFIKSIFHPICESFISKFEDHLYSEERIATKSKENQLGNSKLNLNAIYDSSSNIRSFDLSDSTTAIFSHEYRSLFDSVIDTNSFGFFSVTMSQVNQATEILLRSINNDKFKQQNPGVNINVGGSLYNEKLNPNSAASVYKKESAEVIWPGFCFSLLTMSSTLSPSLHQAALQGYFNLARKASVSFFFHESYISRILTLIGLSIVYMDDNLISNSMKFSESVFKDKMIIHFTKFWGSQVAFLYSHPRFQAQIVDILKPYSSLQQTMNAHKLVKKPFPEQLEIISIMHHMFSLLFDINTSMFDFNEDDDDDDNESYNQINLNKCRQKCITYKGIESELDLQVKSDINRSTEIINQRLPIDFEFSIPIKLHGSKIKIHHINRDFTKISDNIIAFTAITTYVPHQVFFVEKVQSTDSMMTFANIFYLFNQMLKYSYPTRSRNIRLSVSLPIEIGEGMIMYTFPSDSIPISRFRFCHSHDRELEEAIFGVKHVVPFFLKQHVVNSAIIDAKEYIELRKKIVANFAAYSAIRSIFSLPQPKEEELFVSFRTAEFPLILSHFSIPKEYARTATMIPKILVDFFSTSSNPQTEGDQQEQQHKEEEEEEEVNDQQTESKKDDGNDAQGNNKVENDNEDDRIIIDDDSSILDGGHDNFDTSDLLFGLQSDGSESHNEFNPAGANDATQSSNENEGANAEPENNNNVGGGDENNEEDGGDDDDDDVAAEGVDSETRFDRHFELAFASVHSSFVSYIEIFRSFVEMPIQDSLHSVNKQIDNILAARDVIEASLFDYAPPFSEGSSGSDSVEWFSRITDYVQNSKGPFERAPEEPPRAITIPPPSTTVIASSTSRDSFAISTPTNSVGNFGASSGLGLSDEFGAFDMGGLANFGGVGVGVGVSDSGVGLSLGGQSGNISAMSSMNSINSFASRSPINPSPSFDIPQEISRNSSLMNFSRTPQEAQQNPTPSIGLFGSNSFDFGSGGFDQSQQQMMNMQMMQQQQQQQTQPQPQVYINGRMNSYDSGFGFNNPQPVPKVVSPQIQINPPRPPPPPAIQQQQQQQQQMHQPSNDIIGNDDQDEDSSYSFFF